MNRKQFTFFASYLESVEDLPQEVRGVLFDAIILYSLRDKEPEFSQNDIVAKAVFTAIRPVLDNSKKKAKSGQKGGKKKTTPKQPASKEEANTKQPASKEEAIGKERKGKEKERSGENINKEKKFCPIQFKPSWIPKGHWDSLLENRKFKKLQNSQLALQTFINAVGEAVNHGFSATDCIEQFCSGGWKRFNWEWMKNSDNAGDKKKTFSQIRNENNKQACREFAEEG